MSMSCRAPVAGLTAQPADPRAASTVNPAPQLRAMRVAMGRKIAGSRFASFPSVRRLFMVRHMKLRGRKGILGIVLLVLVAAAGLVGSQDRKSTRLNSSHSQISYAVFCLKKKKNIRRPPSYDILRRSWIGTPNAVAILTSL